MAGLFDLLNTVIGKITQNSVTYATAPTPPDGDSSTKVATTAFVADKTAAIPSGNVAVWSRGFTCREGSNYSYILYAPSGGTWFCWGSVSYGRLDVSDKIKTWSSNGQIVSGGGQVDIYSNTHVYSNPGIKNNNGLAIKIA